jgi:hypothetical protein
MAVGSCTRISSICNAKGPAVVISATLKAKQKKGNESRESLHNISGSHSRQELQGKELLAILKAKVVAQIFLSFFLRGYRNRF